MMPNFLDSLHTGQCCHSPILVVRGISILLFALVSLNISGCGGFPFYCYLGFCTMLAPLVPCSTDTDCDDSLGCSTDKCGANGECVFTALCQMDHCLEANCNDCEEFQCVECIADEECTDDNHCTTDACNNHVCSFTLIDCDDQLACTTDGCDSATGTCTHDLTAEATNCDDGIFCNGSEVLVDCICVAGEPPCEPIGFGGSACNEELRLCGDPCLSQCELAGPSCSEQPIESFGDFQTTIDYWMVRHANLFALGDQDFPYMIGGTCEANTLRFLTFHFGFTSMTRFFDSGTLQFVGLYGTTDGIFPSCNGINYWPGRTSCASATVTEVYLGTIYDVGDTVAFPYPEDFEAP